MDLSQVDDINNFLCDVFAVPTIGHVENIDKLFDTEKACLNYMALYRHPQVLSVIGYSQLFKMLFGFLPSFACVAQATNDLSQFDFLHATEFIKSRTIYKYARDGSDLLRSLDKAKLVATEIMYKVLNNPKEARHYIMEWITRNLTTPCDFTSSLFTVYKTLCAPYRNHDRVASHNYIPGITCDILAWNDDATIHPYDYDRNTYHITMNLNYFRGALGKPLVIIDDDVPTQVANSILESICAYHSTTRIAVAAPLPMTFGSKYNIARIHPSYIPHHIASKAYYVTTNPSKSASVGSTQVVPCIVDPDESFLPTKSIIFITNKEHASNIVARQLSTDPLCVPTFTHQEISNAYLSIALNLTDAEPVQNRAIIYNALIPQLPNTLEALHNPKGKKRKHNAIFLLDTRENPLSLLSLYVSLNNADPLHWDIMIATHPKSVEYYKKHFPQATFITDHPQLSQTPFDIEACNVYMKSPELWTELSLYKKIMIVQDDGILAKPGILETTLVSDNTYVGAPWLPCPANQELSKITKMVGNGGLCIRDVGDMLRIATTYAHEANMLFNDKLQPIQEDVFFAHYATKVPSLEQAAIFSTEQVFFTNSLGFHKIWMYHPRKRILEFAFSILN